MTVRGRALLIPLGILGAVIAVWVVVLPIWTDSTWIDPITGCVRSQRIWFGVVPGRTNLERSELSRWLERREGLHRPDWVFLSGTDHYWVFGTCRACGGFTNSEILPLHAGELNTLFVRAASDKEILAFVNIMRIGTRDEKRQAAEDAARKALVSLENAP